MTENNEQLEPKIYIACLASYNAGMLHGEYVDATLEPDEIREEIQRVLESSPIKDAEEYAIHDYEDFCEVELGEYPDLEEVSNVAKFLVEHGELGAEILSHFCCDLEEARKAIEEQYLGEYESLEDYAEEYVEQLGLDIPESIQNYVDYKSLGRDMELGGDVYTIKTAYKEVHVFINH